MAIVRRYYQTANTAATLPYGSVSAGGGAGTSVSPYPDFSGVEALVESAAGAGDALELLFHPACVFHNTSTTFDTWTSPGRIGGGYASITIKRWEDIVTSEPLYAEWYPTIDGHTYLTNGDFTQGSISGGVWSAGSGDVYRTTAVINISGNSPTRIRCWGGHQLGDNTGEYLIAGLFCDGLSDITDEGDFCMTGSAANFYLYFKTGTVGQSPATKYGYFSFIGWSEEGGTSLQVQNALNVTFDTFQSIGGAMNFETSADGQQIENVTLIRPRTRMASGGNAWTVRPTQDHVTSFAVNTVIRDPDLHAGNPTTQFKTTATSELAAQNGLNHQGSMDGLWIYNPKITGFSHAQIQCQRANVIGAPDGDVYPRNCHIILDDASDGKGVLTGGPNYQRGLNWAIPGVSTIGPIRVSQQTVQSQIVGTVQLRGIYYDDTCVAWNDTNTSLNNQNIDHHITIIASVHGGDDGAHSFSAAVQNTRLCGTRHDCVAGFAVYWNNNNSTNAMTIRGSLFRDDGHDRFRVAVSTASSGWTRRKTPIYGRSTSVDQPTYQRMLNNLFLMSNTVGTVEGMVNIHKSGAGQSVNDSASTSPVNQYDEVVSGEDAAINYTSARIAGNQELVGVTSGFDFNDELVYVGTRKTPVQTSSRPGRGYR